MHRSFAVYNALQHAVCAMVMVVSGRRDRERGVGGYRRSAGTARGLERRRTLLDQVVEDLAANGLVDFSLRRAARAADTTHKVILYHFADADELLVEAVLELRERRIGAALAASLADIERGGSLASRVEEIWRVLVDDSTGLRVLDQAIGLTLYDPARYQELGRQASAQYLPALVSLCPEEWTDQRKFDVSHFIMATLRGFLVHWLTAQETTGIDGGMRAFLQALDAEEGRQPEAEA